MRATGRRNTSGSCTKRINRGGAHTERCECDPHTVRTGFAREDERVVYDTITELNEARTLSQPAYDRALAALGLDLLIELIAAAGFYTMVAMTLNAFDAPVPGGKRPLP